MDSKLLIKEVLKEKDISKKLQGLSSLLVNGEAEIENWVLREVIESCLALDANARLKEVGYAILLKNMELFVADGLETWFDGIAFDLTLEDEPTSAIGALKMIPVLSNSLLLRFFKTCDPMAKLRALLDTQSLPLSFETVRQYLRICDRFFALHQGDSLSSEPAESIEDRFFLKRQLHDFSVAAVDVILNHAVNPATCDELCNFCFWCLSSFGMLSEESFGKTRCPDARLSASFFRLLCDRAKRKTFQIINRSKQLPANARLGSITFLSCLLRHICSSKETTVRDTSNSDDTLWNGPELARFWAEDAVLKLLPRTLNPWCLYLICRAIVQIGTCAGMEIGRIFWGSVVSRTVSTLLHMGFAEDTVFSVDLDPLQLGWNWKTPQVFDQECLVLLCTTLNWADERTVWLVVPNALHAIIKVEDATVQSFMFFALWRRVARLVTVGGDLCRSGIASLSEDSILTNLIHGLSVLGISNVSEVRQAVCVAMLQELLASADSEGVREQWLQGMAQFLHMSEPCLWWGGTNAAQGLWLKCLATVATYLHGGCALQPSEHIFRGTAATPGGDSRLSMDSPFANPSPVSIRSSPQVEKPPSPDDQSDPENQFQSLLGRVVGSAAHKYDETSAQLPIWSLACAHWNGGNEPFKSREDKLAASLSRSNIFEEPEDPTASEYPSDLPWGIVLLLKKLEEAVLLERENETHDMMLASHSSSRQLSSLHTTVHICPPPSLESAMSEAPSGHEHVLRLLAVLAALHSLAQRWPQLSKRVGTIAKKLIRPEFPRMVAERAQGMLHSCSLLSSLPDGPFHAPPLDVRTPGLVESQKNSCLLQDARAVGRFGYEGEFDPSATTALHAAALVASGLSFGGPQRRGLDLLCTEVSASSDALHVQIRSSLSLERPGALVFLVYLTNTTNLKLLNVRISAFTRGSVRLADPDSAELLLTELLQPAAQVQWPVRAVVAPLQEEWEMPSLSVELSFLRAGDPLGEGSLHQATVFRAVAAEETAVDVDAAPDFGAAVIYSNVSVAAREFCLEPLDLLRAVPLREDRPLQVFFSTWKVLPWNRFAHFKRKVGAESSECVLLQKCEGLFQIVSLPALNGSQLAGCVAQIGCSGEPSFLALLVHRVLEGGMEQLTTEVRCSAALPTAVVNALLGQLAAGCYETQVCAFNSADGGLGDSLLHQVGKSSEEGETTDREALTRRALERWKALQLRRQKRGADRL